MGGGVVHSDANGAWDMCRGSVTEVEEAGVEGLGPPY